MSSLAKNNNPKVVFIKMNDDEFKEVDIEKQADNFYN